MQIIKNKELKEENGNLKSFYSKKPSIKMTIPEFQREYVWEKDNYIQFYKDVIAAKNNAHFLGTVNLYEKKDNNNNAAICY